MTDKWPLTFMNSQARSCLLFTGSDLGICKSLLGPDLDRPREFEASNVCDLFFLFYFFFHLQNAVVVLTYLVGSETAVPRKCS